MGNVRFIPQAWVNDHAVEVDHDRGSAVYDVGEIPPTIRSDTYESDRYKDHPNAPAWVREHQGPFSVHIVEQPPRLREAVAVT
jgi:hypothetical protein